MIKLIESTRRSEIAEHYITSNVTWKLNIAQLWEELRK